MAQLDRYWVFAALCVLIAAWLFSLILRERLTLQGSLSFLFFLGLLGGLALLPGPTARVAQGMGFTLLSNFLFSVLIGVLALLHLSALVWLSRVELRSIALTQEVALLREKLERTLGEGSQGEREGGEGFERRTGTR